MAKEIWKDIADPFWGEYYLVSSKGQIRSKRMVQVTTSKGNWDRKRHRKKQVLKFLTYDNDPRLCVWLSAKGIKDRFFVAEEVLKAFVPKPKKELHEFIYNEGTGEFDKVFLAYKFPRHINGKITNCDASNLMWIPFKDIMDDGVRMQKVGGRWRDLVHPRIIDSYQICDEGIIRRKASELRKGNGKSKEPYIQSYPSREQFPRFASNGAQLTVSLKGKSLDKHITVKVQVGEEVAKAFIDKPRLKDSQGKLIARNYLFYKDTYHENCHYTNLEWKAKNETYKNRIARRDLINNH